MKGQSCQNNPARKRKKSDEKGICSMERFREKGGSREDE